MNDTLYNLSYILSEGVDASITYGRADGCRCGCCYEYKVTYREINFPGPDTVSSFSGETLENVIEKAYKGLLEYESR